MAPSASSGVSAQPSLEASTLPLHDLRRHAQASLIHLLDGTHGVHRGMKKFLVIDPGVSGPLALVASISVLKEHGVDKLFHLQPGIGQNIEANLHDGRDGHEPKVEIFFLMRPAIANVNLVASLVMELGEGRGEDRYHFTACFTPRKTVICEKILASEGVLGSLHLEEFPAMGLIPFDEDVVSMEMEHVFRDVQVDKDFSALFDVASAIMQLQNMCGRIPRVQGKGRCAKVVCNILQRMQAEAASDGSGGGKSGRGSGEGPRIDGIVLLDRSVDLISPMCTQLTYEGLVDEILGIHNGLVEVPAAAQPQPSEPKKAARGGHASAAAAAPAKKVPLNSSDMLFRELRDLNFASVGPKLRNRTMHMREEYKEINQRTFSEVHQFVKKLNIMPILDRHTELASLIQERTACDAAFIRRLRHEQDLLDGRGVEAACEYVEELLFLHKEGLESVLRLLSLISLSNGGIPKKQYDALRWGILHLHGHQHLFTLQSLHAAGLIKRVDGGRNHFTQIKKSFRLIGDDLTGSEDDSNPTDISYVYSGYAPLSCRIVDAAMRPLGLGAMEEVLKLIPGPQFDFSVGGLHHRDQANGAEDSGADASGKRRCVLVVFIGGVTFAEISALRFMGSQGGMNCNFIVMTTKLINGSSLISSLSKSSSTP